MRHLTEKHEEFRDEVRSEFKAAKADIAEIKAILTQARGGWRTMVVIGGALSVIATAASYVWDWLAPLFRALPR
ncbi:hypothetical protein FO470_17290 [Starkeya sp. 3C]|uniref:Haemolysin XhlA n=1 Tax=Ancylobacter moscoviensis TaxID=2597768 RepID=A0ABY3DMG4_9HYPH|nr:hypothetical protein [Ancylobacter moscoviensis]TSJ60505.1 hypothetical protein FO470_17290 [Ancylobacter moscoviensis]